MKKIKYFISLTILAVISISCGKLDLAPIDYYGSTNFWNNEAQVKGYIYGLHSRMRSYYQNYFLMGEARGGIHKNGTSYLGSSLDYSSPIKNNALSAVNTGINSWGGFYTGILNVNLGIQQVEDVNTTPYLSNESRNLYLGQLYGMRAFYYFWLYRTWGGVPIITDVKVLEGVTTALPLYTERSTPNETLDFIKSDIEMSETYFGTNFTMSDKASTWSKYATLMLKCEVYLWSAKVTTGDQIPAPSDLTTAETAVGQVIGNFTLQTNFSDLFSTAKKGNSEIIFALRFLDNESTNWGNLFLYGEAIFVGVVYSIKGRLMNDTLNLKSTGLLRHEYIWNLWKSYDSLDARRSATFLDYYKVNGNPDGGVVMKKFAGEVNSNNARVYTSDIPVYRYAEALLLMAEIQNKKGADPSDYINQVRSRAYGSNFDQMLNGYTNGTFAENELAILAERDKEFAGENKRWFDVVRMQDSGNTPLVFSSDVTYGAAIPILDQTTESHKLLWPVNVSTINNDPLLEQTEGY